MARRRWARALPRVVVNVECGGAEHQVVLQRGRLVLDAHNPSAEAAVFALGGASNPCFEVYRSWRSREHWEQALRPRGPGFHQLYRRPPLPTSLLKPLELGVARGWERRADRGDRDARALLEEGITSRSLPAIVEAVGSARRAFGGGPITRLDIHVGSSVSASGTMTEKETSLTVRLKRDWYRSVGLPRATDELGSFVLAREPTVRLLCWEQTSGGRWSARVREVPI